MSIKPENIKRHKSVFIYQPNNIHVQYLNVSLDLNIVNYSDENVLQYHNLPTPPSILFDKNNTNIPSNCIPSTTVEIDPTSIFYDTSKVYDVVN